MDIVKREMKKRKSEKRYSGSHIQGCYQIENVGIKACVIIGNGDLKVRISKLS